LAGRDFDSERYARQVGNLLLSITEKFIGSGIEAANGQGSWAQQALFLVELKNGGAISVSEVAANLKVKQTVLARLKDKLSWKGAAGKTQNRKNSKGPQGAPPDNGEKIADEISQNYLETIGRALRGASRRERENFLTMLILVDESFGMVAEP